MSGSKVKEFTFEAEGKEELKERLRELVGTRSVRAAARDWGLSFSTLNNYLTKSTEPAFTAMQKIAHKERVSLDWLAYGSASTTTKTTNHDLGEAAKEHKAKGKLTSAWLAVLDSLDENEAQALLRVIHKKGVDGIVQVAAANSLDIGLLQLPTEEKERLMALHEAKKGASESCVENNSVDESQKKAG
ncbi:transcriptional regulator [Yersinia pseudotuberculosis]|uniref:HTH cro/C1-type domain-containing protein n=1 Tax=Yersinia pseudotuberculosis serotype O:3 (strain YPIII) TaxID=502800 RepID=A0A0H3B0F2_YERPY|nr:transcriptional regulator [Yersinia pseudotuberculosis]AJJ57398.1 putative regulatory protein [Yersinia pseudotuberculosis YPIII]AYW86362.1 transcriptional regulator [Yersinia pseudotuberculosis]AYX00999.1 transcriptional regulator [Yersinia pseudotuberculosis]AZA28755.1 transcriptional regulator [Yersinia pseudotuberculosis]MBK1422607.1 transcriptional regulator [Yersinia pseudotuberculosis]